METALIPVSIHMSDLKPSLKKILLLYNITKTTISIKNIRTIIIFFFLVTYTREQQQINRITLKILKYKKIYLKTYLKKKVKIN